MSGILYITGVNTAVGKTTLAVELLRRARERKISITALKPFCTGGREDAQRLHALQSALTLDELNPFHFEQPITPLLAARNAGQKITLDQLLPVFERAFKTGLPFLVEGAGGLLSPLGERFSFLDVIRKFPGHTCIVAPNILGTLNATLLTAAQLSAPFSIVLMDPKIPDASTPTNPALLAELLPQTPIHIIPFLENNAPAPAETLDAILDGWLLHI